jgi:hypothetical protein
MKVIGIDSGKQRDSFAIVGVERIYEGWNPKFLVKNAQRWLGRNYIDVEKDIYKLHQKHPYDQYIIELNNVGHHVYEILSFEMGLPCIPITTAKDLKDPKKKIDPRIMDKNDMVRKMIHWFQDGSIVFPKNPNKEVFELKRQLSIFAEHKTEAGNVSYYAEGSEHDDLVMALMFCCWFLKGSPLKIVKV